MQRLNIVILLPDEKKVDRLYVLLKKDGLR